MFSFRHMSPRLPSLDVGDERGSDTKGLGNMSISLTRNQASSDVQDNLICQDGVMVALTFGSSDGFRPVSLGSPALRGAVAVVVSVGSQKEMIPANAPSIVTVMKDAHPIRDWPKLNNPRGTVSEDKSLGIVGESLASESSVSLIVDMSDPLPALSLRSKSGFFANLPPELIFDTFVLTHC
jgi:hypothetical protein